MKSSIFHFMVSCERGLGMAFFIKEMAVQTLSQHRQAARPTTSLAVSARIVGRRQNKFRWGKGGKEGVMLGSCTSGTLLLLGWAELKSFIISRPLLIASYFIQRHGCRSRRTDTSREQGESKGRSFSPCRFLHLHPVPRPATLKNHFNK